MVRALRFSPLPIGCWMGRGQGEGQACPHRKTLPEAEALAPHPSPLPDIRRGEGAETRAPSSKWKLLRQVQSRNSRAKLKADTPAPSSKPKLPRQARSSLSLLRCQCEIASVQ